MQFDRLPRDLMHIVFQYAFQFEGDYFRIGDDLYKRTSREGYEVCGKVLDSDYWTDDGRHAYSVYSTQVINSKLQTVYVCKVACKALIQE